jgi:hypothetical protein
MEQQIRFLSTNRPRNNFPTLTSSKRSESILLLDFCRSLLKQRLISKSSKELRVFRELELNGYGISDLLLFEYNRTPKKNYYTNQTLTVFEIKIKDWKKAIRQAFRYRYYSNRSIVVLPIEHIQSAKNNISAFKELNVGLWGYDRKDKRIIKCFTPRIRKPLNQQAKEKALSIIKQKIRSQQSS